MYKVALMLIMILLWGCGTNTIHNESSELASIGHEEITNGLTMFTDSLEFFVEYPALVVGEKATFFIHVTRMKSFKPDTSGQIVVEFGEAKAETAQQEEPGIYAVNLLPEKSGKLSLCIKWRGPEYTGLVSDTLRVYDDETVAVEAERAEDDPLIVEFSKEKAWSNDFKVEQMEPRVFSSVIRASGEMLPVPGEKQHVVARSDGIVRFAVKTLVQGSKVTRGQILFTISGQDMAENNIGVRFSERRSHFEQSREEYARHNRLHAEGIISDKQFQETRLRYEVDSAAYYALSASISEQGLSIFATLSGYLHELNVAEGQYVETGQEMATISSNQVMLLRADVPQQYYGQLGMIATANFRPAYAARTYTMEELGGKLLARGSSVAENNHYMPVYFEVDNDGTLLEGAYVDFYLLTHGNNRLLVVPVNAIIEEQGNKFVYVQQTGVRFIKRSVLTGETDGQFVVILSGLASGERVVTRGAMILKAASMAQAMPSHNHDH